MNELIKVESRQIGPSSVQTVDVRDVHEFLGIKKDFSDWVKVQIGRARLVDGRDYTCSPSRVSSPSGTKHRIDYFMTLDAAKQIAMMSETDRGFEVRDYFLECERRAQSASASPIDMHAALNDPSVLRGTLLTYVEQVIALKQQVDQAAPKLAQLDRIARSDGSFCIRDAAKNLQIQEKKLKQLLVQEKWAYRRPTGSGLLAYSDKIQAGLMEHKVSNGEKSDGSEWTGTQARITPKGLVKLAELLAPLPPPLSSANQGNLPLH